MTLGAVCSVLSNGVIRSQAAAWLVTSGDGGSIIDPDVTQQACRTPRTARFDVFVLS